jgi:hypothetical protein
MLLKYECPRQFLASHLQLHLLLDALLHVPGLDGSIDLLEGLHVLPHVQALAHDEAEEVGGRGENVEVEAAVEKVDGEAKHHAEPDRQVVKRAQMHLQDRAISVGLFELVANPNEGVVDTHGEDEDGQEVVPGEVPHLDHELHVCDLYRRLELVLTIIIAVNEVIEKVHRSVS